MPDVRRPSEDASNLPLPLVTSFYQFEVGFEWLPQASVEKQNRDFKMGFAKDSSRGLFLRKSPFIAVNKCVPGKILEKY